MRFAISLGVGGIPSSAADVVVVVVVVVVVPPPAAVSVVVLVTVGIAAEAQELEGGVGEALEDLSDRPYPARVGRDLTRPAPAFHRDENRLPLV
jgi:hypothetical protein